MISKISVSLVCLFAVVFCQETEHSILDVEGELPAKPPMLANQVQSLVMSSFEAYRRLIKDSGEIQDFLRERLCLPTMVRVEKLDPLVLSDSVCYEHKDKETPDIGKVLMTVNNIKFYGLSDFRVESIQNRGRNLNFLHRVPKLTTEANYTVDYYLFNQIPLRISEGVLKSAIAEAKINGTFQMFPDALHSWFRVASVNITTACEEPLDVVVEPKYIISNRFVINRETISIFGQMIRSVLPKVGEFLKLTYGKATELHRA